jgi:HlyD family secretion protein
MKQQLFRQAALDRIASPDRLDEMLRVASPKQGAMLAAAFLLSAAVGLWAWFGRVTTTADGRAVLMRTGGVVSVNAPGSGQVAEFSIKPGNTIRFHQIVARISNPLLSEQIRLAGEALVEAQRDAERTVELRVRAAQLRSTAMDRERRNLEHEIAGLERQGLFAAEVVSQQEQLLSYGIITKHALVEAQHKVMDIQNEMARRRAQIEQLEAERFANEATPQDAKAAALQHIGDLERKLAGLRQEMRQTTVVTSPYDGEVVEVKTYAGGLVAAGAPLLTIQPRQRMLEALAYVPTSQAKLVRAGMEAKLSPSTVRKEEHGYLQATVISVSDYPLSPAALMRRFENESLTAAMAADGPVTEIRLALHSEPATFSGYRWSSAKGPQVLLSSGTLCDVRIVTKQQRPLRLILPLWKEGLGVS